MVRFHSNFQIIFNCTSGIEVTILAPFSHLNNVTSPFKGRMTWKRDTMETIEGTPLINHIYTYFICQDLTNKLLTRPKAHEAWQFFLSRTFSK